MVEWGINHTVLDLVAVKVDQKVQGLVLDSVVLHVDEGWVCQSENDFKTFMFLIQNIHIYI